MFLIRSDPSSNSHITQNKKKIVLKMVFESYIIWSGINFWTLFANTLPLSRLCLATLAFLLLRE